MFIALSPFALTLALCPAADLTVGPAGSGASFSSIQAAIDAAVPGDRIFVAAGNYLENLWIDKPIQVLGAGSGLTTLTGVTPTPCSPATSQILLDCNPATVEIRNVPAGGVVRIAGMQIVDAPQLTFAFFYNGGAVTVGSVASPVELIDLDLVEDPQVGGSGIDLQIKDASAVTAIAVRNSPPHVTGGPAVRIGSKLPIASSRSNATFVDCSFTGGNITGSGTLLQSAPAMVVQNSTVQMATTTLKGASQFLIFGNEIGNPGLILENSEAVIYGGSALIGKSIGDCPAPLTCFAGSGANLDALSKLTFAQDATLLGGTQGSTGAIAPGLLALPGSVAINLQRRLPTLEIEPAAAAPGDALRVRITGEPGATLVRALALKTGPGISLGSALTKLTLDPNSLSVFPAISIPPSGGVVLPSQIPAAPALVGLTILEQTLQLTLAGDLDLSPTAAVYVLP